MNLQHILLRENSKTPKATCDMIPSTLPSEKAKTTRTKTKNKIPQISDYQGLEVRREVDYGGARGNKGGDGS